MDISDLLSLIHPALAIAVVFPLIGNVVLMSWQTRQRRLQIAAGTKSKIPPIVGVEHVKLGKILTAAVVGVTLIALFYGIFEHIINDKVWDKSPFQVIFIVLMFFAAIASLVFLYQSRTPLWRGIFATLSGAAVVVLGCQDGIYRRTNEWYISHYYIGIAVTLLMIFSLAIVEDIYKDRSNRWRTVHIVLNCVALLLFIGQGMTGPRDLLEIPLSWQKPYIYSCDFNNRTCPKP